MRALPFLARIAAVTLVVPLLLATPATAQAAPAIASAEPTSGPAGAQVQVNGSGLASVETVLFGDLEDEGSLVETSFAIHSDSVLFFEMPAMEPGQYGVIVESPYGEGRACCLELTGPDDDDTTDAKEPDDGAVSRPDPSESSCQVPEQNVQCNDLGRIAMPSQRDIRGERIQITTALRIDYDFQAQGARWVMFSIRNVTADGNNPVTVNVDRFATQHGDVITTKVEDDKPYETNLWVDIIDLPIGEPITIDMTVGATDRGAFRLETLVMLFDRGYAPLQDASGIDVSLFSFTLLGVNKATSAEPAGGISRVGNLPAPGAALAALAVIGVVAFVARRRSA